MDIMLLSTTHAGPQLHQIILWSQRKRLNSSGGLKDGNKAVM